MQLLKISNYNEFVDYMQIFQKHYKVEKLISNGHKTKTSWGMYGYCEACDNATKFMLDWNYSDKITPNFRERLICGDCGLNNRQRFVFGKSKENRKYLLI